MCNIIIWEALKKNRPLDNRLKSQLGMTYNINSYLKAKSRAIADPDKASKRKMMTKKKNAAAPPDLRRCGKELDFTVDEKVNHHF